MTDKKALEEAFEELEYEDYVCPACKGTGEGRWESSNCYKCKGTGGYPKQYMDSDYD